MANQNEIKEMVGIVELQLMTSMSDMISALRKLRIRHYDEAKSILVQVWDQVRDLTEMIPPEEGE